MYFNENKDQEEKPKQPPAVGPMIEKALFESRNICIFGEVEMDMAKQACLQILALAHHSTDPITLIINSPGGHVESGYTIFDTIRYVPAPVRIIGTGWVASIAAIIYLAVPKARRFSFPNTRYLLHQPSGGTGGPVTDVKIQAQEILKTKEHINRILAKETGAPFAKVEADTDRDYWLSAEEAIAYGMVGKIIHHLADIA